MKYYCRECGSENVSHAMWVNPNTDKVGECFGTWNNQDTSFCEDCEAKGSIEVEERPLKNTSRDDLDRMGTLLTRATKAELELSVLKKRMKEVIEMSGLPEV